MSTKIKVVFTHRPLSLHTDLYPLFWKNDSFAHAKKVASDKAALWLNNDIETSERVGKAEGWVGEDHMSESMAWTQKVQNEDKICAILKPTVFLYILWSWWNQRKNKTKITKPKPPQTQSTQSVTKGEHLLKQRISSQQGWITYRKESGKN